MVPARSLVVGLMVLAGAPPSGSSVSARGRAQAQPAASSAPLQPTVRPTLPTDNATVWLVPDSKDSARTGSRAAQALARAARALDKGDPRDALAALPEKGLDDATLADYGAYLRGLALMRADRRAEAADVFAALEARKPAGYLAEAAVLRAAEIADLRSDAAAAYRLYNTLDAEKTATPDLVLTRKAAAARLAGRLDEAKAAYRAVFYDHPLSDLAAAAATELVTLGDTPLRPATDAGRALAFNRARALFAARRYAEARSALEALRDDLTGDDRDLADLRLAECEFHLRRYAQARDRLTIWIDRGARQAEARFYHASALRGLKDIEPFVARVRELVAAFPESVWAEEALNSLATHHILTDDDAKAIEVFREQYRRFPAGARAERAAWKIGWSAFRGGNDREAIQVFESAARTFPRGDMRPAWIYWAGRAHERLHAGQAAIERYRLVATDYLNSYYGRLAVARLKQLGQPATPIESTNAQAGVARRPAPAADGVSALPPTRELIRTLLSLELYDLAMAELEYAQRAWGSSPAIVATIAWVHHRRGDLLRGTQSAKRAYPQYVAAGGEQLPASLQKVVFPVEHWELIARHAAARGLDPFLVAALIAQESGYDASARSAANAYGLMQILPKTGRRLARTAGIRRFSVSMLTQPEVNIRLGTIYFAQLVKQFGGKVHLALAGYNAGETRARRWQAEKPGLEREEFIDDIPFPETQGYVKRIISSTEDYRRLYGPDGVPSASGGTSRDRPSRR